MVQSVLRQLLVLAALLGSPLLSAGTAGSDQLFWVPTLEQALAMASHTGKPIFAMYYTCVGESCPTYSGTTTVY